MGTGDRQLFSDIRGWVDAAPELSVGERSIELDDVLFGRYPIKRLDISLDGRMIASFVPLAAVVIAANGRVDVTGPISRTLLLYLEVVSGLQTTMRTERGDIVSTSVHPAFRGVDRPGWYWVTSAREREARIVDRSTFGKILDEVADYDLASA